MQPAGPLMTEHRLIERMIELIKDKRKVMQETNLVDVYFIDAAVDFFKTYADLTHHGKEEHILFRDLARKDLASDHRKTMEKLIDEHVYARRKVSEIAAAQQEYLAGNSGAVETMIAVMDELCVFYPRHIDTEDHHFFLPAMSYLNKEEQDSMLQQFTEFDSTLIHKKYAGLVGGFEES